jgi:hypothetical protein
MSAALYEASYLVGKPSGTPMVMLIVALVLFALGAVVALLAPSAGAPRNLYGALVAAGLVFFVLAFMTS